MSDIIISGPATLWFAPIGTDIPSDGESFEDAGWQLVGRRLDRPARQVYEWKDANSKREFAYKPISVTMTFTIVGESLPYRRRQSLLDLARYTHWPYTN